MGNIFHKTFTVDYKAEMPTRDEIEAVKAKHPPDESCNATSLLVAVAGDDIKGVAILLRSREFDVTAKVERGIDALKMVISFSLNPELIDVLLKAPDGMCLLNGRDDSDFTPLHFAALKPSEQHIYIKTLLSYGEIDVTLKTKGGDTALDIATRFRRYTNIRLLTEYAVLRSKLNTKSMVPVTNKTR